MKTLRKTLAIALTLCLAANAFAYNCPAPKDILVIPLTPSDVPIPMPALWFGPKMAGATDAMGFGFGGREAGPLMGSGKATVNGRPGWACYYGSRINLTAAEVREKLAHISNANRLLGLFDQTRGIANSQTFNLGTLAYEQA